MAFREVNVNEVKEVLRVWLGGRVPATEGAHDRRALRGRPQNGPAVRRAAQVAGLQRTDGVEALDDGLIGAVTEAVGPARPNGHGSA